MELSSAIGQPDEDTNGRFTATHWSVVLAAGEADSPRRSAALEKLCSTYWQPIYAFIQGSGYGVHDAQDLTQDFLAHLLARNPFASLESSRGKFRSFLLVSLKNFLADEHAKARAAKRGGGQAVLSLDQEAIEAICQQDMNAGLPAWKLFDRRWAWAITDQALARLHEEFTATGKAELFARLQTFLSNEGTAAHYAAAAQDLGMTAGAAAVAVHRMRQRYRALVRREIAQTVTGPVELDEEMSYLVEVLAS
jgi:DNA-directed RNA polymerase specialized sigma24 family protein